MLCTAGWRPSALPMASTMNWTRICRAWARARDPTGHPGDRRTPPIGLLPRLFNVDDRGAPRYGLDTLTDGGRRGGSRKLGPATKGQHSGGETGVGDEQAGEQ